MTDLATPPSPAPVSAAPASVAPATDTVAFADPPTLGRRQVLVAEAPARPWSARLRAGAAVAGRSTLAIGLFLALWEIAPRAGLTDPVFLPPFSEVVVALADAARSGILWSHVSASLGRAAVGFGLAVLGAIPLGLAIGWFRPVAQLLTPVLELFRNTAALALLPVFILILGIGETSKIAIVAYACAFPVILTTITGVRTVDPLLIRSARSLGLGPVRLFAHVVLPAAVPTIFTGVRMAGSVSILVLVAAEMIGAKAGLGYWITAAQFNFQIPQMYAGIVVVALVGLAINGALLLLERRLSRWRTAS